MRVLLDTHALIWWFYQRTRLTSHVHATIDDRANQIYVSAVSAWEIGKKVTAGKLPFAEGLLKDFMPTIADAGFVGLSITIEHMLQSVALPSPHKDPFDRIIAAQAVVESMILISIDPRMAEMGAVVRW